MLLVSPLDFSRHRQCGLKQLSGATSPFLSETSPCHSDLEVYSVIFNAVCFVCGPIARKHHLLLALALDLWEDWNCHIPRMKHHTSSHQVCIDAQRTFRFFSFFVCFCSVLFCVVLRIEPVSFHIFSSIPSPISCA